MRLNQIKRIFCLALAVLVCTSLLAQSGRRRQGAKVYGARIEKEITPPDSAELARLDSLHVVDSLFKIDSIALQSKSSLERPAFSSARDSIVEDFTNGRRLIYYYGDVTVTYQDVKLTADYMEYDMNSGTVYALGRYDSLKQEWVGRPVMDQAGKSYNMEEVKYNFGTGKAFIKNMITKEDEGILHGRNIKMLKDRSVNMTHGKYTVCDCEHPHYWLELSAAKVISEPSRKTVFGPAHVVIEDVHLPFVGIPFGFVPKRPERATGILMPTFGEENARGFYLRDLGMYFVFGDYLDLSVTGDIYTLGSWAIDLNSRYKVNYKCNGSFTLNYSNDQTGERGSPDFTQSGNFGVKWSHQQDSKAHPGMNFSASVNFSSPSNSRYNSHSVTEALQNQVSSSISFSRNWNGKFNLSINALHSQNSRDSSYSFTLPNVTFSVSTFYPFKRKNRVGKERFYEKFSIGYNTSLQNRINFKASEFDIRNQDFLNKFQNSMTHNFSIGLPNFTLLKYLNVNPSLSYGMNWYFRSYHPEQDEKTGSVRMVQGDQFSSFGIMQTYSGSISMSTRLYGTFNFGKYHKIQAIRHVISPSLSMNLSPELSTAFNGYRTMKYLDAKGQEQEYKYNIYTGASSWSSTKQATASLSIGNNLEAKVRDYADTTGSGSKKVKLIDNLNLGTGWNFLADSLNMRDLSMSMSTSLFNKISINCSASFDPYAMVINKNGSASKVNKFAITQGQGLLRFTTFSISASYSISGKGTINGNDGSRDKNGNPGGGASASGASAGGGGIQGAANAYKRIFYHPVTGEFIPGGWLYYANPNVPWSLNLSASASCRRAWNVEKETMSLAKKDSWSATLNVSGNIKITPKLSINATSGFDFIAKQISTTQISATYDLHCFNIAVSWVPTGTWKSYSFCIAANAAALSDLLRFKKSSSYWDN